MKIRSFLFIPVLLTAFVVVIVHALPPPADPYPLEGGKVKTRAVIVWDAITNRLPETVCVYKVLPQTFTEAMVTQAMAMADFTPSGMEKEMLANQKTMEWQYTNGWSTPQRSLKICPAQGSISIFNYQAESHGTNPPVGVPTFERMDELALQVVKQFGGDAHQLSTNLLSRFGPKINLIDGVWSTNIPVRGCTYPRVPDDGLSFYGNTYAGGLFISFGNHEKVVYMEWSWPKLEPIKKYRTPSLKQMVEYIQTGKATLPAQALVPPYLVGTRWIDTAKQITITALTFNYASISNNTGQVIYPFARFDTKVVLADSSTVSCCILCCPILTEEVDPQ